MPILSRLRRASAFTLIELLVVILIIGILIAVAAPSFLGQTQKAHDSEAKQYLTIAYKAAKASTVVEPYTGSYSATAVIAAINAEGSGLSATSGVCPGGITSTNPKDIIVDPSGTSNDDLKICNDPEHRVFILTITDHGPPVINGPIIFNSDIVIPPAPVASANPAVSGTTQVSQTLTTTTGTWTNSPSTYAYAWLRCTDNVNANIGTACTTITSADATDNNTTYTLVAADEGKYMRSRVTATNAGGATVANSNATAAIVPLPPTASAAPAITGTAQVSQTLTASTGTWTGSPTYAYAWLRCTDNVDANVATACTTITSADATDNNTTYTLVTADEGKYLRSRVTATNAGGAGSATSAATSAITVVETSVSLTTSGGLITDASRSAGAEGDRNSGASSYGVWESRTNLVPNGGYESNTSSWNTDAGTITRVTSEQAFGSASLQISNPAGNYLRANISLGGASVGQARTGSAWVKAQTAGTIGKSLRFLVWDDVAGGTQSYQDITLTGSWQRVTTTWTAANTNAVGFYIGLQGTAAAGDVFGMDGVQLENRDFASPYVETNGASATSAGGQIQGPASALSVTQGWVAARINISGGAAGQQQQILSWGNTSPAVAPTGNLFVSVTLGKLRIYEVNPTCANLFDSTLSVSANVAHTAVFAWTATSFKASLDGGSFQTFARSSACTPSGLYSQFQIGAELPYGQYLNGQISWLATGSGALSDADAATFNSYGSTDPTNLGLLPGTATFRWTADTATAYTR